MLFVAIEFFAFDLLVEGDKDSIFFLPEISFLGGFTDPLYVTTFTVCDILVQALYG